ncbi:homoserine kinase [Virgibacillus oceani]|uniref:Homoserine kinase n=1 Tax=Virgibacillus oceani TaxID=1479511 RepID=A0A917M6J5_9BACI|nr:homoserine kinase [Virgibacillus oceani]GGG80614.1 homoserine kinase [Virgibacillus oceani]
MVGFKLSLPASSANIGPGFDSAGIALNRYLTLQVFENDKWEFEHNSHLLPSFTDYKDHFIYQIAKRLADRHNKSLPACRVKIDSEIPLARGLGSSASAVIAGIELANQLCCLSLTPEDKLAFGTEIEGHPDNVAAVLFGGFVITVKTPKNEIDYFQLPALNLDIVVYIPTFELKTEDARKVLPKSYSRKEAATASGISNLVMASLISGNFELAGRMMEQDLFHEPYRAELIPNYQFIKQAAKNAGAYGTVISGAGPTMISIVPKGTGETTANHIQSLLPDYQVEALMVDTNGLQIKLAAE